MFRLTRSSTRYRSVIQKSVVIVLSSSLLLQALSPAGTLAQEPAPPFPAETLAQPPLVDSQPLLPAAGDGVDAIAAPSLPHTLLASGVSSYTLSAPALYWVITSQCEAPGPRSAAEGDSPSQDSASTAQGSTESIAPASVDAGTPFQIGRISIAGLEPRTIQHIADPSGGPPTYCPQQYKIFSNVVANATHLYWIDANGLVRVPVTAHMGITPEVVDTDWKSNQPAELKIAGNLLLGAFNNDPTPGPFGAMGWSSLDYRDLTTGVSRMVKFEALANYNFNSPDYDGKYLFFKVGSSLRRINLDGTDEQTIANGVGEYVSEGRRLVVCQIDRICIFRHFLFYEQYEGGTVIMRRDLESATTIEFTRREGRVIDAMAIGAIRGESGGEMLLEPNRLLWVEHYSTFPGGGFADPTNHYALNRTSLFDGSKIDALYLLEKVEGAYSHHFYNFLSARGFLFWQDDDAVVRFPVDAEALPVIDMDVTGYEITQGIQQAGNTVRLVQGRYTYLRVFVRSAGADVPNVTMRLKNATTNETIHPIGRQHITVKRNPNPDAIDESFIFRLPLQWTSGPITSLLQAELNPWKMPLEPDYRNNFFTVPPHALAPAYPLKLWLFEMSYAIRRSPSFIEEFTMDEAWRHVAWLKSAYPLAENGLQYKITKLHGGVELGTRVFQTHPDCQRPWMNAEDREFCPVDYARSLLSGYLASSIFGPDVGYYYYALMNMNVALGSAGGRVGAGPNIFVYTGHEVAHMLGRDHPTSMADNPNTPQEEGCGHDPVDANFPYPNGLIGWGDGSVRGLDTVSTADTGAPWSQPSTRIIDDVNYTDFMTYCDDEMQWISPYTWEGIHDWLATHQSVSAADSAAPQAGDFVGLFGAYYTGAAAVFSVTRMSEGTPTAGNPDGPYAIQILDANGAVLTNHRIGSETLDPETASIAEVLPLPAGARTIRTVRVADGALFATQAISANPPQVSAVILPGAPNPVDGVVRIEWTATDADNDPLTASIFYSLDSGASWQPVHMQLSGNSVDLDTTELGGGSAILKVIVSDGVNQSAAQSQPFTVVAKPPQLVIASPQDGALYNWREPILLEGYAWDAVDGGLDGASVQWSNQYGKVGEGATFSTDKLPTGVNLLTMKATNSAGLEASRSVTITIGDQLEGGPPTLAVTPSRIGIQAGWPSTLAYTRTLQFSNVGDLGAIRWTASSSVDWLSIAPASANDVPATVTLTASTADLVMDTPYTATVTITGTTSLNAVQVLHVPVSMTLGNPRSTQPQAPEGSIRLWLPIVEK